MKRTGAAIKLVIVLIILAESAVLAYLYKKHRSQHLTTIALQNTLTRTMEAVHALQKDVAEKAQVVSDIERRFSAAGAPGQSMPKEQNAAYLRKRLKESKEMELQMYERIEELSRKQAEMESHAARPGATPATPVPMATATEQPTAVPTASATPTPAATATAAAQPTPIASATSTPAATATAAAQPTPIASATSTPAAAAQPIPIASATSIPDATSTVAAQQPTSTPTTSATSIPTPRAADTPAAQETPAAEPIAIDEAPQSGEITGQILIMNETYNFIIVNVGSDNGIEAGEEGIIEHDGEQMGRAKVKKLYNKMCLADVVETSPDAKIQKNYLVKFTRGPENNVR